MGFSFVTPAKARASLVKLRTRWTAIPAFAGMTMWATPASASTGEAVNPWVALAYLVSGVFFILALRGLSSPSTSRTGNRFGMAGMLIAVATTLVWSGVVSFILYKIVDVLVGLRPSVEKEREGLDITDHGERAYTA